MAFLRGVLPQLRALFIVFHVAAMLVLALPSPHRLGDRRVWKSPVYQQDFASVAEQLRGVGLEWSARELEDRLWALTQGYLAVRRKLVAPFTPYLTLCRMGQSWRMFSSPQRAPAVLHVELRRGVEDFSPIFIARSERYTWRRTLFDHNRVRKQLGRFGRTQDRARYRDLADFLARDAAAAFPEHRALRVRLARFRSLPPERMRAGEHPEVRFTDTLVYDLEALR